MPYNNDFFGDLPPSSLVENPYVENYNEGKDVPLGGDYLFQDLQDFNFQDGTQYEFQFATP